MIHRQVRDRRVPGTVTHWTFVSPESSHGLLVEVARPYNPVDGKWEPGEGVEA